MSFMVRLMYTIISRYNDNLVRSLKGTELILRGEEDSEAAEILSDIQKIKYSLSEEDYKKVLKSIRDILNLVKKNE